MKTMVHFGAGNIGRSLVGVLFTRADYEVVFVDADARVVDALNQRGQYTVKLMSRDIPENQAGIVVRNVRGLHAMDTQAVSQAIAKAAVVGTSVGAKILPRVLPSIAGGIAAREQPISIIFCENLRRTREHARGILAQNLPAGYPLDRRVGLVETSIGKMVPIMPEAVRARDPLEVWGEPYAKIIADRKGFVDEPPCVEGLVLKDNFGAYVDLKLFVHNFGHAAAAYLGNLAGKRFIWECMQDQAIRSQVRPAMLANGMALRKRYPGEFSAQDIEEHVDDLLARFTNQALGDTVFRVGRDLARKLAPEDRCEGSLRLLQEVGDNPDFACRVIAAALHFDATDESGNALAGDTAIVRDAATRGAAQVLTQVCGLRSPEDDALIKAIQCHYQDIATSSVEE